MQLPLFDCEIFYFILKSAVGAMNETIYKPIKAQKPYEKVIVRWTDMHGSQEEVLSKAVVKRGTDFGSQRDRHKFTRAEKR